MSGTPRDSVEDGKLLEVKGDKLDHFKERWDASPRIESDLVLAGLVAVDGTVARPPASPFSPAVRPAVQPSNRSKSNSSSRVNSERGCGEPSLLARGTSTVARIIDRPDSPVT